MCVCVCVHKNDHLKFQFINDKIQFFLRPSGQFADIFNNVIEMKVKFSSVLYFVM